MEKSSCPVRCIISVVAIALSACDRLSGSDDRYTIANDAKGQVIRLDKRTGEIAVIEGNEIRPLKDAAQAAADRKAKLEELEEAKHWPSNDIPQIGTRMRLSTSWRDGKMYYDFAIVSLEESKRMDEWLAAPVDGRGKAPTIAADKRELVLKKAEAHKPFTLRFEDKNGFELASEALNNLTRIVDSDNTLRFWESKSTLVVSEDDYRRINSWTVNWR